MRKSNFQMNTPILQNLIIKINDNFHPSSDNLTLNISDSKKIIRNSNTSAIVNYTVKVFDSNFNSNIPFFIEISYSGEFVWSMLDESEIQILLENNAPAILLGYIRPLISQLTGNAGFPPLHLPLFNLLD